MSLENTLREMMNEMNLDQLSMRQLNEGGITDKIKTAVGRISGAIDKKVDEYVPYVRTDGRGRQTGLNPRDTDRLHVHHISPRAVAALGLATTLAVGTARDRVGGQFDLHKAEEAGERASASVRSAYQGLQNVARSAQQVPKLAPGAEAAKKPPFFKPRRRLEETLKEHYKQRLEEGLLGLNEAIPLDVLRARVGRDPNAAARTRQRAEAAAAAAGSKPKGKPKDKPKGGKPVEGASPATTPAPQIDLNALRASRQSG